MVIYITVSLQKCIGGFLTHLIEQWPFASSKARHLTGVIQEILNDCVRGTFSDLVKNTNPFLPLFPTSKLVGRSTLSG